MKRWATRFHRCFPDRQYIAGSLAEPEPGHFGRSRCQWEGPAPAPP